MGRLQRKKGARAKKKKQQKVDGRTLEVKSNDSRDGQQKAAVVKTVDKAVQKKPAPAQKKNQPAAGVAAGIVKPNFIEATFQFLREVKVELKKVTWPSRKQTIGSTVVVLVLVLLISIFLGVVDMGLSQLIRVVLG